MSAIGSFAEWLLFTFVGLEADGLETAQLVTFRALGLRHAKGQLLAVQQWLAKIGVKTLYITPGSPWENGYCESFNGSMRDKLLNGEIFFTLAEAQILIEAWRQHYNTVRPHSSLGYRPPAPETAAPPRLPFDSASLHLRPAMAPEATMHQQSTRTTQWGPVTGREMAAW